MSLSNRSEFFPECGFLQIRQEIRLLLIPGGVVLRLLENRTQLTFGCLAVWDKILPHKVITVIILMKRLIRENEKWWYVFIVLALGRLRQQGCKFEANLPLQQNVNKRINKGVSYTLSLYAQRHCQEKLSELFLPKHRRGSV